ncbi:GAF domain-containing protein [Hymenobacter sp. 15J16-1T3B]|uniref:GAF domain-containing protein n=1 Tax=Hymenobacter sp. 15J16-1T3B TaxID=2886941 RepID=UPI001D118C74|nr:GAF domain-containing protein [Hymenobacter sp. 15J16-1T3B]MCC3160563.1 GAF domain-containing protein [Hymenobacter sp. 15J16-1T3B]
MPTPELHDLQVALSPARPAAEALNEALAHIGHHLRVDRCFLYVRDPARGRGRIALAWRLDEAVPDPRHDWQDDTGALPQQDPLFRAALAGQPPVYVDDVEAAGPEVLNRAFERRTFGHRALIHAHILDEQGQLWGILQPCVFGHPRHWTPAERAYVEAALPLLRPVVQNYMQGQSVE